MESSVRTMMAVAAFFALVLSIFGAMFWRAQPTYAGRGRWAIANLLYALCLFLFSLRLVLPDWIGVVGANAVLAAAAILSFEATREYRGLRPRAFLAYAGGTLAVLAVVYFDYVDKNLNARIFAMSAFMGVVAIFCSVTLLREKRPRRTLGVSVSGGMFAISAALLVARAIYFLFAPPLTDLFAPTWVNGAFFLGCALSIACCSTVWKELAGERMLEKAVMQQARLTILPATLLRTQETERKLLARELHDNFGQTLAALSTEAFALPRAQHLATKIGGLANEIHRMSQQLHPAILDDLGLEAALTEECKRFSERLGIPVRFKVTDVPSSLPGDIALCLFRVAQESLGNITKHAGAREVSVCLAGGEASLALFVEDVGDGFDVEQTRGKGGLGLISMQERLRLVGGKLTIHSQPGEGTSVTAFVPLNAIRPE